MKSLVLAEKPSVGKDIARALGCHKVGNGVVEGSQYIVTWALGHLVTLSDPEQYNQKYKTWELNDLPIIPDKLSLVVIPQTGKQFNVVKQQLMRNDVNQIIIATDAGREGELVARWILEKTNCRKPVKRLWISSVTDKAIKDGFANLHDGKEYMNLYNSAVARSEADWLVGINATRALTTKFNSQLSCGRVQTPTVAIIAHRDDDIRNFRPKPFYGITALLKNKMTITWHDSKTKEIRSFDKNIIESRISVLQKEKECTVTRLEKVNKKQYAPALYDLTELQRDCSKRFSFSPKETLDIMQGLYEKHKALTYPRTDSRYISRDIVPTIPERLKACAVGQYTALCNTVLQKPISGGNHFVDDKKVSDHHAIIPTEQRPPLLQFNDREKKVYDLVVRRFLAVLSPPFAYEQINTELKIGMEFFIAKGKTVISAGYKSIYQYDDDDEESTTHEIKEQTLPLMKQGDKIAIDRFTMTEGKTKPPAPFTEATLLSAMENPHKYMQTSSRDIAKTLSETGGLGTVATRADIIDKLFNSFLIEKKGKDIFPTAKGKQLLTLVPNELRSPELTGQWEQKLSKIALGQLKKEEFLQEIRAYTKSAISQIKASDKTYKHENITGNRCPQCGKFMLDVNGKKGKMFVCQDRECGYRQNVSFLSNWRCPNCHKKMETHGDGEKKFIVCGCGFREKYDAFVEKRKNDPGKMTKNEIDGYLKKVNTDVGNGLSDMARALMEAGLTANKKK